MAVTAQTLITRARYRADKFGSTFVNDTNDLLPWCDHGHRELYDLLIEAYGQEYFMTTVDLYLSASTLYSSLSTYNTGKISATHSPPEAISQTVTTTIESASTNFYKLIRFDRDGLRTSTSVAIAGGVTTSHIINEATTNPTRVPFRPFQFSDVVLSDDAQPWPESGAGVQYRLTGNRVYWHPRPSSKQFVRMYYVPRPNALAALTDNIETHAEPWAEYIELYIARMIREKEQDTEGVQSLLEAQMILKQRITNGAPPRDIGQAQHIVDVRSVDEREGFIWPDRWW